MTMFLRVSGLAKDVAERGTKEAATAACIFSSVGWLPFLASGFEFRGFDFVFLGLKPVPGSKSVPGWKPVPRLKLVPGLQPVPGLKPVPGSEFRASRPVARLQGFGIHYPGLGRLSGSGSQGVGFRDHGRR